MPCSSGQGTSEWGLANNAAMQNDVVRALRHLDSLILHSKDLVQSQVGRAVKKLRTHESVSIKNLASKVWTQLVAIRNLILSRTLKINCGTNADDQEVARNHCKRSKSSQILKNAHTLPNQSFDAPQMCLQIEEDCLATFQALRHESFARLVLV